MIPLTPLTIFRDWYIFYKAGTAINEGVSPYLYQGYFYPIQIAWFLSLTTWIPFPIWVMIACTTSFILIALVAKKNAPWILLSVPFIIGMYMGSIDAFLWAPARLLGGWGLSLLTLKPQLAMIVVPIQLASWWREQKRKEIFGFFAGSILLWGIPTLIDPSWVGRWINSIIDAPQRMHSAASIAGFSALTGFEIGYIVLFVIIMAIFLIRKIDLIPLAASFSPFFWASDWTLSAEWASWRFMLLSWMLVPTGLSNNGKQFYFLLGLLVWLEQNPEHVKAWWSKFRASIQRDRNA